MSPRKNMRITYFGPDLDDYLFDVWMQLIFEAQNALGLYVKIRRAALLRAIGRSVSGRDYTWLKKAMYAFLRARFVIQVSDEDGISRLVIGKDRPLYLVSHFAFDDKAESYTFMIDPRWKLIFGDSDYSLIDWNKRMDIRPGHVLARALQRIFASSSDIDQKHELEKLKCRLNYRSPKCKFEKSLKLAILELKRTGIIKDGDLGTLKNGKECLKIVRNKAKSAVDISRV